MGEALKRNTELKALDLCCDFMSTEVEDAFLK